MVKIKKEILKKKPGPAPKPKRLIEHRTKDIPGEEDLPSDKVRIFVAELMVDYNGRRAAIAAGVRPESAKQMAQKWLRDPRVVRVIEEIRREDLAKIELRKEEALEQLLYLATRQGSDFVDDDGKIMPINELGKRADCCIDGIEQEVYSNPETGEERVKTRLKISPKAAAINMAMERLGLKAAVKQEVTVGLPWDQLLPSKEDARARHEAVEQKILGVDSEEA